MTDDPIRPIEGDLSGGKPCARCGRKPVGGYTMVQGVLLCFDCADPSAVVERAMRRVMDDPTKTPRSN